MIIKFNDYLKENKTSIDLKYFALDWDDNILHMPTVIHMDHLVDGEWIPKDVSTSEFAEFRNLKSEWRIRNNSPSEAFSEFRDNGPRGKRAFFQDAIKAIEDKEFGPSWDSFIKCLSHGYIFAIITARGHNPETIKMVVEYIIDNILTEEQQTSLYAHCLKYAYLFGEDYESYDKVPKSKKISETPLVQDYLNQCEFFGVSSEYFIKKFGLGDSSNPEVAKELAVKYFAKKVNDFGEKIKAKSVSLGFSDDDVKNVKHIEKVFKDELSLEYAIDYNIYDTSVRGIPGGTRKRIGIDEGQSSFGLGANTWGTDGSVIPFTKWNSMSSNYYPNSKDEPNDDYHNQFKNQIGEIKDLTADVKYDDGENKKYKKNLKGKKIKFKK